MALDGLALDVFALVILQGNDGVVEVADALTGGWGYQSFLF